MDATTWQGEAEDPVTSSLRSEAQRATEARDWAAAETAWRALLERKSDDNDILIGLAETLRRARQFDEAESLIQSLVYSEPPAKSFLVPSARIAFDRSARENEWLDIAVERWYAVLAIDPGHFESYLKLGHVEVTRGDLEKAREAFSEAEKLHPRHSDLVDGLIRLHLAADDLERAWTVYQRAIRERGAAGVAVASGRLYRLARFLIEKDNLEAAEFVLSQVNERDHAARGWARVQADLSIKRQEWTKAVGHLASFLRGGKLDQDCVQASYLTLRGVCLQPALLSIALIRLRSVIEHSALDLARRAASEDLLDLALRILDASGKTDDDAYRLARAELLLKLDRIDDAKVTAQSILEADPDNVGALNCLSDAYERSREAERELETLIRLDPFMDGNVDHITRKAAAMLRNGRNEDATDVLLSGVQFSPNNERILLQLALIYLHEGQYVLAESFLMEVLRHSPSEPEALLKLAEIGSLLGQVEKARGMYRRYLNERPWDSEALLALRQLEAEPVDETWTDHVADLREKTGKLDSEWRALATVLAETDGLASAIDSLQEGRRWYPASVKLAVALARMLRLAGHHGEALSTIDQAFVSRPYDAKAKREKLLILCEAGRFSEASDWIGDNSAFFEAPETREGGLGLLTHAYFGVGRFRDAFAVYRDSGVSTILRRYLGRPVFAATIDELAASDACLILPAWGIGDEISWSRVYAELAQLLKKPTFACSPQLKPLFERSFPEILLHACQRRTQVSRLPSAIDMTMYDQLPDVRLSLVADNTTWELAQQSDRVSIVTDLLADLRADPDSFQNDRAFLKVDTSRQQEYRRQLDSFGEGLKVGISWTSLEFNTTRAVYLTQLQDWLPAIQVPGVVFVNLQPGDVAAEIDEFEARSGRRIHRIDKLDLQADVDGLAALMSSLDLVISIVNSTSELAGAVGARLWILNRCPTLDWRIANADGRDRLASSATHLMASPRSCAKSLLQETARRLATLASAASPET